MILFSSSFDTLDIKLTESRKVPKIPSLPLLYFDGTEPTVPPLLYPGIDNEDSPAGLDGLNGTTGKDIDPEDPEDELKKAQAAQAKADAGLKDADAAEKKNGNGDK